MLASRRAGSEIVLCGSARDVVNGNLSCFSGFGPSCSRRCVFITGGRRLPHASRPLKRKEKATNFFSKIFRIFRKLFVRFVLSKIFPEIGRAETIRLVQKSSNFELSSRFFGRLKIFIG